jgi:hypothetical protein
VAILALNNQRQLSQSGSATHDSIALAEKTSQEVPDTAQSQYAQLVNSTGSAVGKGKKTDEWDVRGYAVKLLL